MRSPDHALVFATLTLLALVGCRPGLEPVKSAAVVATAPASVRVFTDPPGGTVGLEGSSERVSQGEQLQLSPGRNTLVAEKAGYRTGRLTIEAGVVRPADGDLVVPLGPGYAPLRVSSEPIGATLSVDGDVVGQTPLTIELDAGEHRLTAAYPAHEPMRHRIFVRAGEPEAVRLSLVPQTPATHPPIRTEPARRTESSEKKPAEQDAASAETIAPVAPKPGKLLLTVRLGNTQRKALLQDPLLARELHRALRVGETVRFVLPGTMAWITKARSAYDAEFETQVKTALQTKAGGGAATDSRSGGWLIVPKRQLVPDILMGLARARVTHPLLDLNAAQLPATGEAIQRSPADGVIAVFALDGEDIALSGAKFRVVGRLHLVDLPAGAQPLTLTWQTPPGRLLAVAQGGSRLIEKQATTELLGLEKRLVALTRDTEVLRLVQLTAGQPVRGWDRRELTDNRWGAARLDLSQAELGPHEQPGEYDRIWVVTYADEQGVTQRQDGLHYRVTDRMKESDDNPFLRRAPAR